MKHKSGNPECFWNQIRYLEGKNDNTMQTSFIINGNDSYDQTQIAGSFGEFVIGKVKDSLRMKTSTIEPGAINTLHLHLKAC